MLASLTQVASPINPSTKATHILVVLPQQAVSTPQSIGQVRGTSWTFWAKVSWRRYCRAARWIFPGLDKHPLPPTWRAAHYASGWQWIWSKSLFEQQTLMRKAVQALMEESPAEINFAVYGSERRSLPWRNLRYTSCGSMAPRCLPGKPAKKIPRSNRWEKSPCMDTGEQTILNYCAPKRKEICLRASLPCFRPTN